MSTHNICFRGEIRKISILWDLEKHLIKVYVSVFILFDYSLTFTTLWAYSADEKLIIFFLFSQKIGFDISCKLWR